MTLQQLDVIPKELFVQFEGVLFPVRPTVEYRGKEAREMPVLARQDGFEQLYTPDIIPIYMELNEAEKDGYSSLAEEQPLAQANKLSEEAMIDTLRRFGDGVLHRYTIWAELLDWQPEKRIEGYKLPRGKNAVLYRNWDYKEKDKIDVSDATVIPVKWMEESDDVSKEIVEQLNVPEDTHVWADKKYAINNYDGLNALFWFFGVRERPGLYSDRGPWGRYSNRGALLGVRLSAEEMVENFNPE